MRSFRNDRLKEAILHAAQEFLNRESNRTSLVTATKIDMTDEYSARISISVFPPETTGTVIEFLSRSRSDFSEYFKKHVRVRGVPHIEFLADPDMGSVAPGTLT